MDSIRKYGVTLGTIGIFIGYLYDCYKWYKITHRTREFLTDSYRYLVDYIDEFTAREYKTKMEKFKWIVQSAFVGITCFTHKDRQVGDDFIEVVLSKPCGRQECVRLTKFVIGESRNIFKEDAEILERIDHIEKSIVEVEDQFIHDDVVFTSETQILKHCYPIFKFLGERFENDAKVLEKILFTVSK